MSECVKKMTRPSTKLRTNGNYIDNIDNVPFVLRLSKHERIFSHTLSLGDLKYRRSPAN